MHALHNSGQVHNCLYPKHIFARLSQDGAAARLIDLEKTRPAWLGLRDRVRDLETLHRRSQPPSGSERLRFLLACLGQRRLNTNARRMISAINRRWQQKQEVSA